MIKFVKRLMQHQVQAKTKTDYIRQKLEQGHKVSQLELYTMCQKEGVPELFTTRLGGLVHSLRSQGIQIKTETVKKKGMSYARYYI